MMPTLFPFSQCGPVGPVPGAITLRFLNIPEIAPVRALEPRPLRP